jgi:hypothetical protein
MSHYGINMVVFGPSKGGKSWLGDTTPAPRVVFDAEAGSRFTPSRKRIWNPTAEEPPQDDGSWDTALVVVREYRDVEAGYQWLNSGKHPFRSVTLDSISEIQQRVMDKIAGTAQPTQQQWGELLRTVSDLIRKFRDLATNPIKPLDAVVAIAMATEKNGTVRPYMQGALATTMPYYVDICGYLGFSPMPDGSQVRRLFIGSFPGYETGQRVAGKLGEYVDNPDVSTMLALIRGESVVLPATSSAVSLAITQEG